MPWRWPNWASTRRPRKLLPPICNTTPTATTLPHCAVTSPPGAACIERMKQLPLAIGPAPQATLDSFVPGANQAAWQHVQALAQTLAEVHGARAASPTSNASRPPLYLWGPEGSGKTHLLRALVLQAQAAGMAVGWFDAREPAPWHLNPAWALVVQDDCDALDAAAQHRSFVLFTEAESLGMLWAAAGRVPVVDLPLREDLRTRLGWGHVFALQPLAESETRSVLRQEADRRGIFLSDEVMGFLLLRFPRDLTHLMHLLNCLDDYGLSRGRRITVPLVRQMFAEDGVPDLPHPRAAATDART